MAPLPWVPFSTVTYSLDVKLIVPKPTALSPIYNVVKPYTASMWIAILMAWLVITVIVGFVYIMDGQSGLARVTLDIFGALCGQSVGKDKIKVFHSYLIFMEL